MKKEDWVNKQSESSELLELLNLALERELQVTVQYMMQHGIAAGQKEAGIPLTSSEKQHNFVATHFPYFLPGNSLKKIAITEMRHAEAITERIVLLGGEPVTQPAKIKISKTTRAMLEDDLEQERGAIKLYNQIIETSENTGDQITAKLFRIILKDEESHHKIFSDTLKS
jgi:bacterioferritin